MTRENRESPDVEQRQQIDRLTAEFVDPDVEADFRRRSARRTAQITRQSLLIGGIFFVLFAYSDYAVLGDTNAFWLLLSLRSAILLLIGAVVWHLKRHPAAAMTGGATTTVEALGLLAFLVVAALRPNEIAWHETSVLLITIGFYLFVPNRFVMAMAVNVVGGLGFCVVSLLWLKHDPAQLATGGLLMLLGNVFGAIAGHRQSLLQRQTFRLLAAQRRAKAKLRNEVVYRRHLQVQLERAATTDTLTELYNRGHFLVCANREIVRARRRQSSASLLFLDIDSFKAINDNCGHACGDSALRQVAKLCVATMREGDLLGRLGGEEFAILLPDTDLAGAVEMAERLRRVLAETTLALPDGRRLSITATIGVAACTENDILDAINHADAAMYHGKRSGGNVVVDAIADTSRRPLPDATGPATTRPSDLPSGSC